MKGGLMALGLSKEDNKGLIFLKNFTGKQEFFIFYRI